MHRMSVRAGNVQKCKVSRTCTVFPVVGAGARVSALSLYMLCEHILDTMHIVVVTDPCTNRINMSRHTVCCIVLGACHPPHKVCICVYRTLAVASLHVLDLYMIAVGPPCLGFVVMTCLSALPRACLTSSLCG